MGFQLEGGFGVFPFTETGPVEPEHEALNRRDETYNTGQGYGGDLLQHLQTDPQAVTQRDRLVGMLFANYKTHERPTEKLDIPTVVEINMKVLAIFSVDVRTMDYYIDALLRQTWTDPRLAWNHREGFKNYTQPLVSPTLKENLWLPDLFFRNGKDGYLHKMTLPNYLLRVHPNGEVLYSQKITMRFSCQMDLATFPMDTQYCHMNIGSYGYTLSELQFVWREKEPVELQNNLQLSEFNTPTNFTTLDCTAQSSTSTGNYTCLMAKFSLKRQLGSYLVTTYIPNILIIMVSWLSFYVSVDAAPARVPLGLLSLLGLLTQASSITGNLPRVSYIKAIDLWLIFSIIFVIGVLVEYAIAITMLRQKRKETWRGDVELIVKEELTRWLAACEQGQMASIQGSGGVRGDQGFIQQQLAYFNDLDAFLTKSVIEEARAKKGDKKSRVPVAVESEIDAYSRFLFPTCYIMYNIFYWTYYLAIVKK
ncbi:Glycine receptor subunit alpha-3 [Echinococcus granulosus]|uniref:Glycine receptor subunit alpha 1 n=1 Tax=Echinococcus granulosus TaxID=6210 RepID=U6J8V0_ECHGR|nr:Glycine receptor subunit alpha-3 [Echinococcus granulosus]EUB59532.1 Glycine receptor subunit alpha-3 [Echinococcus granulosus]CDS20521.1 glycine receptor subunit alpha 1 [Echinococcus granulosus]